MTHTVRLLVAPENMEDTNMSAMSELRYVPEVSALEANSIPYRMEAHDWSQETPYVFMHFNDEQDANNFRATMAKRGPDKLVRETL